MKRHILALVTALGVTACVTNGPLCDSADNEVVIDEPLDLEDMEYYEGLFGPDHSCDEVCRDVAYEQGHLIDLILECEMVDASTDEDGYVTCVGILQGESC